MRDLRVLCLSIGIVIISADAIAATQRHRAVTPPTALPSSAALIDKALATGRITVEQAVTYHVFADFDDPRLPAQFHGDDTGVIEGDSDLDAAAHWSSLSPATQQTLAPFFAAPFYVGSWWDLRQATASAVAKPAAAPCAIWVDGSPCPASTNWKNLTGTRMRVWYQASHPEDLPIAADLLVEGDTSIWNDVETILGRPLIVEKGADGRAFLDVAVTDGLPTKVLGRTRAVHEANACSGKGAAYIIISRAAAQLDTARRHSVLAHELFHAGQLTYGSPKDLCLNASTWLLESTATWFEDQKYETVDREHEHATDYLDSTDIAIDDPAAEHARERNYGEYLFFFYLTRIRHLKPTELMTTLWQAREKTDPLHALDAALTALGAPLDKSWPEFALYSWNVAPPYDAYAADRLKAVATIQSSGSVSVPLDDYSHEFLRKGVKLPHLSIQYIELDFPDASASSVVVYNGIQRALGEKFVSELGTVITANPVADPATIKGAHIDALLRINGEYRHQDWTGLPYKTFCRDLKDERFDHLVIVLSNSSVDNELQVQGKYGPTLQATNIGCYAWEGGADLTLNEKDSVNDVMHVKDLRLEAFGDVPIDDNTPARRLFKVAKGTYTWSVTGVSGGCGYTGFLASQDFVHPADFFFTFPYANTRLALARARGVMVDLGLTWTALQNVVTETCGQQTTKILWSAAQFLLVTTPDQQAAQIGSDGGSLSIDTSEVGLFAKQQKGSWTLHAVRQ